MFYARVARRSECVTRSFNHCWSCFMLTCHTTPHPFLAIHTISWADGDERGQGAWNGSRPQCNDICTQYPSDPDSIYCTDMDRICNGFLNVSDEEYTEIILGKKENGGLSLFDMLQSPTAGRTRFTADIPTRSICTQNATNFSCRYNYLCKWCSVSFCSLFLSLLFGFLLPVFPCLDQSFSSAAFFFPIHHLFPLMFVPHPLSSMLNNDNEG